MFFQIDWHNCMDILHTVLHLKKNIVYIKRYLDVACQFNLLKCVIKLFLLFNFFIQIYKILWSFICHAFLLLNFAKKHYIDIQVNYYYFLHISPFFSEGSVPSLEPKLPAVSRWVSVLAFPCPESTPALSCFPACTQPLLKNIFIQLPH